MRYVQPYGIVDPQAPYVNANPAVGLAGSIPPAATFEHTMREIIHLEEKAGLVPNDADLYQILKAVRTQKANWAIDTGGTNSLVCTFDPALQAYNNGFVVRIKVSHTNTGPSQIDCGPGFRIITRIDGSPTAPGDMPTGGIAVLCYVDNEFQLLNPNIFAAIELAMVGVTGGGAPGPTGDSTMYVTNVYNGFSGMIGYQNPGTYDWTVPDSVTRAWCRLWAGGGPAMAVDTCGSPRAHPGGDGGYAENLVSLIPGTLMRIVVGAGAPPPMPSIWNPATLDGPWPTTNGGINRWVYGVGDYKMVRDTVGQSSTFGPAGGTAILSCTGGHGPYANPSGGGIPSPGERGKGTGGVLNRANGVYGAGGGTRQTSDGVYGDYALFTGDPGAFILVY